VADSSHNKSSWVQENILHPGENSLKEMANTGINLVNLALPKKTELSKFEIDYNEKKTFVGTLVSGAVSVVPYAVAGGVLGRVLRCVPAGESAWALHSEQFAQIGGAAAYDALRDVRPGETKLGNVAGSIAGFGTFEAGNYAIKGLSLGENRAVQLAAQLPLRFGVGVAGGTMGSVFSDLGSGKAPDLGKIPEAAITSGGLNVLLPTAQSLIFKGLGLRSPVAPAEHVDSNAGMRESSDSGRPQRQGEKTNASPRAERAPAVSLRQTRYSPQVDPEFVDRTLGNDEKVRIWYEPLGSRSAWTWTPDCIDVKSESSRPFVIEREPVAAGDRLSRWSIKLPGSPGLSRYGEIEAHEGGRELSIFGREISLKWATPEDIARAFTLKPPIDPVIKPQIEQFERLAEPLDALQFDNEIADFRNPRAVADTVNGTFKQMDAFLSAHQSAALKDAMLDWADGNPNEMVRTYVKDYYRWHPDAWTRYFDEMVHEEAESATHPGSAIDGRYDLMRAQQDLPKMLERGLTESQLEETRDNLLRLLDDGRDPQSISRSPEVTRSEDYKRAALQGFIHAANPDSISQWDHPTCALAGIEHFLYKKHPEVATRMLRDVLETGQYVTTDGTTIKIDPFSLQPEPTALRYDRNEMETPYRTYASQILQTLAGNIHWQRATVNPDGVKVPKGSLRFELTTDEQGRMKEYVVDHANGDKRWKLGFTYGEVEDIQRQIAPNIESLRVPSEAYDSPQTLQSWLSAVPQDKFPVRVGVDSRHLDNDFSKDKILYHAMNINRVFDPDAANGSNKTMAEVKNPQTGGVHNMTIRDLWKMAWQRPRYEDNPRLIPTQLRLDLGGTLHIKPRRSVLGEPPPAQLDLDFSQPPQLELPF